MAVVSDAPVPSLRAGVGGILELSPPVDAAVGSTFLGGGALKSRRVLTSDRGSLPPNPLLEIIHLSKQFVGSTHRAVNDICLTVYEGEIFALLGPSGCGKTTLMRLLAGFETPNEGEIFLRGDPITHRPAYARPLNMMFQSYALFPHMTVEQNVAFGLQQEKKLSKQHIAARVSEVLEMVKMRSYGASYPANLSGGQQQRVALARSLVKQPQLLLLDEPLGALDRQTREHTQVELINIQHLLGITCIVVTHDQEEALSMANRIAIMEHGRIVQIGTPQEIYDTPNSRYVAEFIGSVNMFEGIVLDGNAMHHRWVIRSPAIASDLTITSPMHLEPHSAVWVAIRPEEMHISTMPPGDGGNSITGRIIDVAFLGKHIVYHVLVQEKQMVQVSVPTGAHLYDPTLRVDCGVFITWHDTDGVVLTH